MTRASDRHGAARSGSPALPRRSVLLAAVAALLLWDVSARAQSPTATVPKRRVLVTAIVEHPALDAARDGVREALESEGLRDVVIEFESAQGSPAIAAQIARRFVGEAPAVIVAISTPSAQAVAAATRTIPVVFSAVTDPVAARLVASMERPGANITGVSDLSPIEAQLDAVRRITPGVRRLGVVYNPGEVNAVAHVERLRTAAANSGFALVEAPSPRTVDVQPAVRSLVGKADAIYVPTDNTVVSAFEGAAKVASEAKLPIYASDTDTVARGALAAVGFDYRDVGRQTGRVVARILRGEPAGQIAVQTVETTALHLNKSVASRIGIAFPPDVTASAKKIIE